MNQELILEVKNLSVSFGKEPVLSGISFEVRKGDALVILGPNGAGKTVLFRALLGAIPWQGQIKWKKGLRLGYIPQKITFDRKIPLTVKEFFLLKSRQFWFPEKKFLGHLSHELDVVGLGRPVLDKGVGELSGGEFQRLVVAWAILDHPDVLLFDEPTAGIDIGGEETIYHIIQRLREDRGTTVLLISHELNVVYRYSSRVLCLNRHMICYGEPQEVLTPAELSKLYGAGRYYRHVHPPHR